MTKIKLHKKRLEIINNFHSNIDNSKNVLSVKGNFINIWHFVLCSYRLKVILLKYMCMVHYFFKFKKSLPVSLYDFINLSIHIIIIILKTIHFHSMHSIRILF